MIFPLYSFVRAAGFFLCLFFAGLVQSTDLEHLKLRIPGHALKASAYSSDGMWYAAGADDLILFDVHTRFQHSVLNINESFSVLAVSFWPDSRSLGVLNLAFSGNQREFIRYSIPEGKVIQRFPVLPVLDNNVRSKIAIDPEGKRIAISNKQKIAVYSVSSGEVIWEWVPDAKTNPNSSYSAFDVTPDWKYFLFNLQRISFPEKKSVRAVKWALDSTFFWSNLISPDGNQAIAFGGPNGTEKKLFDLSTGKLLRSVTSKFGTKQAIVTKDFRFFIGDQGIWNIETGELTEKRAYQNFHMIDSLALAPDGQEISIGNVRTTLFGFAAIKSDLGDGTWMQDDSAGREIAYFFVPGRNSVFVNTGVGIQKPGGGPVVDLGTGQWSSDLEPVTLGYNLAAVSPDRSMGVDYNTHLTHWNGRSVKLLSDELRERAFRWIPVFGGNSYIALVCDKGYYLYDIKAATLTDFYPLALNLSHAVLSLSEDGKWLGVIDGDWRGKHIALYRTGTAEAVIPREPWEIKSQAFLAFSGNRYWIKAFGKTTEIFQLTTADNTAEPEWRLKKEIRIETGRIGGIDVQDEKVLISNTNGRAEVFDLQSGELMVTLFADFSSPLSAVLFDKSGKLISSNINNPRERFLAR